MTRLIKYICAISFVAIIAGCNNDREVLGRLEQIKKAGDSNPREALKMLDSLTTQIKDESEYVQMKYDLLSLRLHDKANDIPSSDIKAITVLDYFEKKDNNLEKQEAYYYTGSVYRDLQDTPRALENFYKSVDIATNSCECDSTMLRNTYSQISYLLSDVQDYQRANEFAKKEYEIAKEIDKITINSLIHLGVSYQCLDSLDKAKEWLDKAYYKLLESDSITDAEAVYCLIYNYSRILDYKQANACYMLSKKLPENSFYYAKYKNLGTYFTLINEPHSAILCLKRVIDDNNNLFTVFDASKNLFSLYYKKGNYKEAAYYADIFRHTSETLDLGRRQELAATINNQYQYHLDKNREMQLVADKEKSRTWLVAVSAGALLLLSSLILLMMHRKNRHLKRTLMLSNELEEMKTSQDKLLEKISVKEKELKSSRKAYDNTKEELESVRERLQEVSDEVEVQKSELKNKEKELADKIEQNKSLFSLIHRAEFEKNAAEIVSKVQMSAEGMKNMTPSDWNELYAAIDTMYPDFKSILLDKLGIISGRDMMITYLMRIGLSNRQIMNMTNIPRTSLYRQIKDLQWIRTLDGSAIIHQSPHKHTASPKTTNSRKRSKKKVNK